MAETPAIWPQTIHQQPQRPEVTPPGKNEAETQYVIGGLAVEVESTNSQNSKPVRYEHRVDTEHYTS